MNELILSLAVVALPTIPAVIVALAHYRSAQAEMIWAERCDPKNPNFRLPVVDRGTRRNRQ
jgi:hypothetical protein